MNLTIRSILALTSIVAIYVMVFSAEYFWVKQFGQLFSFLLACCLATFPFWLQTKLTPFWLTYITTTILVLIPVTMIQNSEINESLYRVLGGIIEMLKTNVASVELSFLMDVNSFNILKYFIAPLVGLTAAGLMQFLFLSLSETKSSAEA